MTERHESVRHADVVTIYDDECYSALPTRSGAYLVSDSTKDCALTRRTKVGRVIPRAKTRVGSTTGLMPGARPETAKSNRPAYSGSKRDRKRAMADSRMARNALSSN